MALERIAHSVNFNTGISMAEYNEVPAGQTQGQTQSAVLPGATTVSEALAEIFPGSPGVSGQILSMLAAEGSSTLLRSGNGFRNAARKAASNLRKNASASSEEAAMEIERLLEDTELLDLYRASLLES